MTEATLEKAVCEECGVDVRENTLFCYNCGSSVSQDPVDKNATGGKDIEPGLADDSASAVADTDATEAALKDLSERFKIDEAEDDRLAKAAAERRKARVKGSRKNIQYVWEPTPESGTRLFLLTAIMIACLSALVVFLAVYWK